MADPLVDAMHRNGDDLLSVVEDLLDKVCDPKTMSEYTAYPLRIASYNGRFDVIRLLLSKGADRSQLRWTGLHFSIAYGSLKDVQGAVIGTSYLEIRDFFGRTPFLFSILVGDIRKTEVLVKAGANIDAVGRRGQRPAGLALQKDNDVMLGWLMKNGFDIWQADSRGNDTMTEAASRGAAKCLHFLLDQSAGSSKPKYSLPGATEAATTAEVVHLLLKAGADINDVSRETRAKMLGYRTEEEPNIDQKGYEEGRTRVFGRSNPELSSNAFWHAMVECGGSGYCAAAKFGDPRKIIGEPTLDGRKIRHTISSDGKSRFFIFKDFKVGRVEPVWTYSRLGMSITPLTDGRFIEIAGEHEDDYMSDFCIYNDVFVHDGKGGYKIYTYPRDVFPPTDFHTATLVGKKIYIIGNLGYYEDRVPGHTPVYCLDIETLRIEKIETSGAMPGWIFEHKAYGNGDSITVQSGKVILPDNVTRDVDRGQEFVLCLKTKVWERRMPP